MNREIEQSLSKPVEPFQTKDRTSLQMAKSLGDLITEFLMVQVDIMTQQNAVVQRQNTRMNQLLGKFSDLQDKMEDKSKVVDIQNDVVNAQNTRVDEMHQKFLALYDEMEQLKTVKD